MCSPEFEFYNSKKKKAYRSRSVKNAKNRAFCLLADWKREFVSFASFSCRKEKRRRELKFLASELGVPILCLSQLNRTSDESTRPSPSELRDSGSIEQDANKVIFDVEYREKFE